MHFYSIHTHTTLLTSGFFFWSGTDFVLFFFFFLIVFFIRNGNSIPQIFKGESRAWGGTMYGHCTLGCIVMRITCTFLWSFVYTRCGKLKGERTLKENSVMSVKVESKNPNSANKKLGEKKEQLWSNANSISIQWSHCSLQALAYRAQRKQCRWRRSAQCSGSTGAQCSKWA